MSDTEDGAQQIRSDREALKTLSLVEIWLRKVKRAEKEMEEWETEAEKAVEVYEAGITAKTTFNIFHSNVQVLAPALYNSTPIPDVRRRYGDKDEIGRAVADTLERATSYSVDQYNFDGLMRAIVVETCVKGAGAARVRYEVRNEPQMSPDGQPVLDEQTGQPMERVSYQKVGCEYVPFRRFIMGPGRMWDELPFIAYCHDLTEDDCRDILDLDEKRIKALGFEDEKDEDEKDEQAQKGIFKTLKAYEIWDKRNRKVLWITPEDKRQPLRVLDDPLELPEFFPSPEPMIFSKRIASMVPICPYQVYRPLIEQLDTVTKRITNLVKQLKVRGIYDAALKGSLDLLKDAEDGQYIEAQDVTQFAQGAGGLEKAIHHFPMAETIAAIAQLRIDMESIKQTIYEVTGISDILRGATKAQETLGAQELKQQNAALRIKHMQAEVARFARDLFRLKGAIIAKHFDTQILQSMTQLEVTPEIEQVLRSDQLRGYRIDIESDSTIRGDVARKQEMMNQFLAGTGQFASAMASVIPLMPQMLPTVVEVYSGFARLFDLGKQAEDAIENLSQLAQQAQQQGDEKPSPEEQKMQLEQQKMEMQAQADAQKMQAEQKMAAEKHQMDMAKIAAEMEFKRAEHEMKLQQMQVDAQARLIERDDQRAMRDEDLRIKQAMAQIDVSKSLREKGLDQSDDGNVIDPIATAIEAMGASVVELAKRVTDEHKTVLKAIQSPKTISITTGKDGRVAGAVVKSGTVS